MAKFEDVFEDTQSLFTKYISEIENLNGVNIKVLSNNRLKEIGKAVKANDLLKHLSDVDVIIILNEQIFDQLEDEQKNMVVEELVAPIYFDYERDRVILSKPDVNTYSLLLRKYGYDQYERLFESIKALFAEKEEAEAEM